MQKPYTSLYWIFQIVGWSLFFTLTVLYFSIVHSEPISQTQVLSTTGFCLGGLLLTHAFRYQLKKRAWLALPYLSIGVRIVAANVLMAIVLDGMIIAWGVLFGYRLTTKSDWLDLLGGVLNTSLVFGIWSLIYFVSFAFRNYKREEIDKLKAERSLKDSELARLRSQMNPHFVFNALNSIRGLVMENPSQAQEAITQLSYLLRNFLNTENVTLTTLGNEIKTVQDYLNLEKLRYEARLKFEVEIAANTLQATLPTMMVQTLVENAVKHGISNSIEGGTIAIKSWIEANKLYISVANTGSLAPRREGAEVESGFGIKSSKERLNLQYGSEANLRLEEQNGNVVATIALPITTL